MDGNLCFNDKPAKIFRSKRVLLQKFGFWSPTKSCFNDKPAKIFRLKPPKARINERF